MERADDRSFMFLVIELLQSLCTSSSVRFVRWSFGGSISVCGMNHDDVSMFDGSHGSREKEAHADEWEAFEVLRHLYYENNITRVHQVGTYPRRSLQY